MGNERSDAVQIARFVAAMLVVVTHATFYAVERIGSPLGVWHFGEIGVPIFFVISGLVMVLSTADTPANTDGACTFLLRRFVRIVPLYWLATAAKVVVAVVAPGVVHHNHFDPSHAVQSFFFIPYFNAAGEVRPMHGVGWTLLHEVFFYLLFAATLAAGRRPVLWVSGALLVLFALGSGLQDKSAFVTVATSPLNLNFVVGMAVGWLLLSGRSTRSWVIAAAVCAAAAWSLFGLGAGLVLAVGATVLAFAFHRLAPVWRPAIALGDSSYSLYLFHPFVTPALVVFLGKWLALDPLMTIGLACVLTVGIAHALHLSIERPVVRRARAMLAARSLA